MILNILTLFPDFFVSPLKQSLINRAIERSLIKVNICNIRDFTTDKHKVVDDSPFGGGAGMIMKIDPLYRALKYVEENTGHSYKILLTPRGRAFTQTKAMELSKMDNLTFICGRYEGVDERITYFIDEEISIGDYVIMGGESAVLVVLEAVVRLLPSVLGKEESVKEETFVEGLLEYPQYTRPEDFMGYKVPSILLSGNHKEIYKWRLYQSLLKTYKNRPDLLDKLVLTEEMKEFLVKIKKDYAQ